MYCWTWVTILDNGLPLVDPTNAATQPFRTCASIKRDSRRDNEKGTPNMQALLHANGLGDELKLRATRFLSGTGHEFIVLDLTCHDGEVTLFLTNEQIGELPAQICDAIANMRLAHEVGHEVTKELANA